MSDEWDDDSLAAELGLIDTSAQISEPVIPLADIDFTALVRELAPRPQFAALVEARNRLAQDDL